MSLKVKESLGLLVASGLIYVWFAHRMLDGWRLADQSAGAILEVVIAVIVATAIIYAIVSGVLAAMNRDKTAEDERDALIDGKATRNEMVALNAIVNTVVLHLLAREVYSPSILPDFNLLTLPALVFTLFTGLWIAEWVRLISILWYSRT